MLFAMIVADSILSHCHSLARRGTVERVRGIGFSKMTKEKKEDVHRTNHVELMR
jgi:hypothetical protein